MFVAGQNITITNCRFPNVGPSVIVIDDTASGGTDTKGIDIDNLYITNTLESSGYYNPAISVDSNCIGINIRHVNNVGSDITNLMGTGSTNASIEFVDDRRWDGRMHGSVYGTMNTTMGLNDDQAGYLSFSAAAYGIAAVSGNVDAAGPCMIAFRVGDGSAYCSVLSSSGPTVAGTTGALAGTTGTDTNLTISAHTSLNRLYFENRTGGAKGQYVTILSLSAGYYTGHTEL
jgi:hypothetical protein